MAKFFDIVNKVTSLYVTYRGRYVMAVDGKIFIPHQDGFYKKLDNRAIINHVNQRYAIGVFSAEYGSKFICFDIDVHDKEVAKKVIDGLCEFGFHKEHIYVSTSGGKGFHVEMFFNDLVYVDDLRNLYLWVIKRKGLDSKKVEFRPTFHQAIKVPLSIHHKTGNVCWYLDNETFEPIESLDYVMGIVQLDRDEVEKMIQEKINPADLLDKKENKKAASFSSASYMQEETNMTGPGMRHKMMLAIAIRERYRGASQEEIQAKLEAWVAEQNPEFITDSWDFVMKDVESLASYVWNDKFKTYSKEIFITENDLKTLLGLHGMFKKKLLFLIILFYRKFGIVRMSYERMAEYIGSSRNGVIKALASLKEEGGMISTKQGAAYVSEGKLRSTSNEYVYKPDMCELPDNKIFVDWDFNKESFQETYVRFMQEHVPHDMWDKVFTKKERNELNG